MASQRMGQIFKGVSQSEPLLPISTLSFVVGDGHDAQDVAVIQINDRERKALKDEPSGSMQIYGPSPRRFGNSPYRLRNHYAEFDRHLWASTAVPSIASLISILASG